MHSPEPTNTTRIVRDTFIDMALYLECLFLLHGVNDILVEDIIHCMEEGYAKTMKNLKKIDIPLFYGFVQVLLPLFSQPLALNRIINRYKSQRDSAVCENPIIQ